MVKIFAARDAVTEGVRFIADVARGAACGCVCLTCGSPLVAKQGQANDWHFAHEQSQERPECPAGALNLLRRIAVEELSQVRWSVAPFAVACAGVPEMVRWTDQPSGPIEVTPWAEMPGASAATLQLVEHGTASVYVVIGREPAPDHGGEPALRLHVPLPESAAIRSEDDARAYVRAHMRLEWLYLPDLQGRVAAAEKAAGDHFAALRSQAEAERARAAGAHWAGVRRTLEFAPRQFPAFEPPSPPRPAPPRSSSSVDRGSISWAPGIAGHGSIQYRLLKDGSQWVYYPAGPHGWRLAPVPDLFDGWDECLPGSLATVDGTGWLRVVSEERLFLWFNSRTAALKIDSDPSVIEAMFESPTLD